MPNVSKRGEVMPASPIRRLVPLANDAIKRGLKVHRLNIGQPDVPTPPEAFEALTKINRDVLEYSPSEGLLSLRQKLQQYYNRFNIKVDVDDISGTTGGSEAVLFAFRACLDPGDEIILPDPA
ncbi:MAG: aminotransferase class I/II-fold pyridoxal phosphate-dependent enzyme, partial [Muribaculaceae bacterium]|nr:aminotransferase class I/II-fold pyridoxal phosphate-dependent enzyme [Muribaculaceae bacterium]